MRSGSSRLALHRRGPIGYRVFRVQVAAALCSEAYVRREVRALRDYTFIQCDDAGRDGERIWVSPVRAGAFWLYYF